MKPIKKAPIIMLLCLLCCVVWADFFPIGGYGCEKLYQADSCNINTVLFYHGGRWDTVDAWFNLAGELDMRIILANAVVEPDTQSENPLAPNITRFSGGQWSIYEAESSDFSHGLGGKIYDDAASGDTAWVVNDTVPGWLQYDLWTDEQYHYWCTYTKDTLSDSLTYHVYYNLKTNDTSETNPICTLFVIKKVEGEPDTIKASRVLTGQDFADAGGGYKQFLVSFMMDQYEVGEMDYAIWYIGTGETHDSLYSDKVDVIDVVADSLKNEEYNTPIREIATHYNAKAAMFRYYMFDEPKPDQFWASKQVNLLLWNEDTTRGGIQAVCHHKNFEAYLNSVNPDELFIDHYPFWGKECRWEPGRIPEDGGDTFQIQIDTMCSSILSEARRVVKSHSNKEFWYIPQAFGHAIPDTITHEWNSIWNDSIPYADEGWWREPTPREMRLMVWLALAYGAKGICYYRYHSAPEHFVMDDYTDDHWNVGLTNPQEEGAIKRPLWYTIQSINQELASLSDVLLTLESDTVFKVADGIPTNCCSIDSVSDSLIQIGTFQDTTSDSSDYFIIVNRHCFPSDTLEILVDINCPDLLFLYDCHTKEAITPEDTAPPFRFAVELLPGVGRLLRLVPFQQEFAINQHEDYTNLPFVALRTKATSSLGVDSMKITQSYTKPDSMRASYTTGWIPYDSAYCWYLWESIEAQNTVRVQYKVGGFSETPEYWKSIDFDDLPPTGSFVINNDSAFTTNSSVTLQNSVTDARSGVSKMRFGNKYLLNLVENSSFGVDSSWLTDTAIYHDSLELFEIPVCTTGNYFYQAIPPDSLASFYDDTLLLWIDLVSDNFVGNAMLQVQYIYAPDTIPPRNPHPCATSVTIPHGTNAWVSHYNLYSLFTLQPDTSVTFVEARVGTWIGGSESNSGRIFIDNLRLDVVGPSDDYTTFDDYDTLKHDWALAPGNGVRTVYGQFADGAGNETGIGVDSIIVDAVPPVGPYAFSEKSENDVVLLWNTVTLDTSGNADTIDYYVVYRDTFAAFIPDVQNPSSVVDYPDTTYVDSSALDYSESYYYLVKAVDCAHNVSAKSNMGYKLNKFFNENKDKTDRNWVSLPWHSNYSTVSDLTDDLSPEGDPLTAITRLDDTLQQYESYIWAGMWFGTNFAIEPGRAYEMITTVDTSLMLVGSNDPDGLITLNENPTKTDKNWVAIPYNAVYATVSEITNEYSCEGEAISKITNMRDDQLYENWVFEPRFVYDWIGTNFAIEPGRGYEMVAVTDTTWNPTEHCNEAEGLFLAGNGHMNVRANVFLGSSIEPDRTPAWVAESPCHDEALEIAVNGQSTNEGAEVYRRNPDAHTAPDQTSSSYSATESEDTYGDRGGPGAWPDERKISHIVLSYFDVRGFENVVFTTYRVKRPEDVLTEDMVGSNFITNQVDAAIYFDVGNFATPWSHGEEAILIVEATKDGNAYYDVVDYFLDEKVDIQRLRDVTLEPMPEPGSSSLSSTVFLENINNNDNIIGYSLYENGMRLNNAVLHDAQAIAGDVSVRLVIKGGHETVYGSGGIQSNPDQETPISFRFSIVPNPFVKQIRVDYALPKQAYVEAAIYDVTGRQVKTLLSSEHSPGYHSVAWDGTDDIGRTLPSGVYFIKFEADQYCARGKILFVE